MSRTARLDLRSFQQELATLRTALLSSDGDALEAMFARARIARNRWIEESRPQTTAQVPNSAHNQSS